VLRDLERLGYTTYPGIVSASEMGAPHRRQRIFTMAYADGRSGRSETRQPVTATGHPTAGLGPAEPGRRCSSGPVMANTNSQPGRPWRTGDTEQSAQGRDASRSGGGPAMANPDRDWEQQPSGRERHEWRRTSDGGKARRSMADTGSAGRVAGRGGSAVPGSTSGTGRHSGAHLAGHAWWATEPDVDRVAYGVPGRVDRLRALGNAVVPHCAQFIGEILAAELGSPTTTSQGGQDGH
jgi:DNA (cytosine-5)-methyltransferase 1